MVNTTNNNQNDNRHTINGSSNRNSGEINSASQRSRPLEGQHINNNNPNNFRSAQHSTFFSRIVASITGLFRSMNCRSNQAIDLNNQSPHNGGHDHNSNVQLDQSSVVEPNVNPVGERMNLTHSRPLSTEERTERLEDIQESSQEIRARIAVLQAEIEQLEAQRAQNLTFLRTLNLNRAFDSGHRTQLELSEGDEFNILTEWSQKNPSKPFKVKYHGSNAVDQGGPTNDAMTASYDQLKIHKITQFDHDNGVQELTSLQVVDNNNREVAKDKFNKFGHLIGMSLQLNRNNIVILTDIPLSDNIFNDIMSHQPLIKALNAQQDSNLSPLQQLLTYILQPENHDATEQEKQAHSILKSLVSTSASQDDFKSYLQQIRAPLIPISSKNRSRLVPNKTSLNDPLVQQLWTEEELSNPIKELTRILTLPASKESLISILEINNDDLNKPATEEATGLARTLLEHSEVNEAYTEQELVNIITHLEREISDPNREVLFGKLLEEFDYDLNIMVDITEATSMIHSFHEQYHQAFYLPIEAATDLLNYVDNIAAPKLSMAIGFSQIHELLHANEKVSDGEALKKRVVQSESPSEIFQRHLLKDGNATQFFDTYFKIDIPDNSPRLIEAKRGVKESILHIMNHSTDDQLRDLLKYCSGTTALLASPPIKLTIVGDYQDNPLIENIPLPVAHSCIKQLDININSILRRETPHIDERFFKHQLTKAIHLQKQYVDGLA